MATSRFKINSFKSVMMKGAYLLGMKPKKIAQKFVKQYNKQLAMNLNLYH